MVEWRISDHPVDYAEALAWQEARVAAILAGEADECVWLLEHPPVLTAGTSAKPSDLLQPGRFPVHHVGRGGEYTYHGPGQRIAYAMLDLNKRGRDVRQYVRNLEEWAILTIGEFGIRGERRADRVGVWVTRPDRPVLPSGTMAEDKIAAIGVRLRKWVAFHGISVNVEPELDHYDVIVPCGIRDYGVTSLFDLGVPSTMSSVDTALMGMFETVFGPKD